jgi:multiple sugar transport system permease protein
MIALFAAYAFARLEFPGKRIILVTVLAGLLLPVYATLLPLFRILANAHLINTYPGIVLVYTSGFLPLAIWIMYNYFASVPRDIEEAAFVDGATPVKALWRVMIPVSMPGIAATAIIVFLLGWAQFIFPLVLSSDLTTEPVTVVMAALYGQRIQPFTLLTAMGVLAAALPGVIALLLNRYIVQGIMAGSIK